MISNGETARAVSALLLEASGKLDASVRLVMETCSEDEFKAYRLAIGQVMADMLLGIMNPLYARHPDLKPKGLA